MMSETPLSPTSKVTKKKNSAKPSAEASLPSKSGKNSDPESERLAKALKNVPSHTLRDNGTEALKRLKVDLSKIGKLPPINKILAESRGGRSTAIEAMRFSDGTLSAQFLEKWDSLSDHDQERLTIEVVAAAANIEPKHLLGEIMLAMREYSVNKVKILAVSSHPDVMEKRIEFAMLSGGTRDRDALDTILGALPKKSTTFIDKFFAVEKTEEEDDEEEVVPAPVAQQEFVSDENFVFPDCETMQERLSPIRQKLLDAKK
jgi:hypothetical protein